MPSGIWTSASGAAAQSLSVDTIANNLANVDTLGFKKDAPAFREYLATLEREKPSVDIPRGPIKEKEFYPLDGRDQAYVVVDGTYTQFKQGGLRVTQGKTDLALEGPGFMEVATPQGIRYTRMGSLKIAQDGRLVTSDGFSVLAGQAQGIAGEAVPAQDLAARAPASVKAREINLQDREGALSITEEGEIYAGDELVSRLSLVEFKDLNRLRKSGTSLFENTDAANVAATATTKVHQGMLEGSNVNPIEEMTKLIQANRLFEQSLKAMKTHGELMGKEANDIGKL